MRRSRRAASVLLLLCCPSIIAGARAVELSGTIWFRDVAIAPDGSHVAWVEKSAAQSGAVVHVLDMRGSGGRIDRPVALEGRRREDAEPAWSPDSQRIAFLSDAGSSGQRQVWVAAAGSAARKVTGLSGYVDRPKWSPDGKEIAFLYVEGGPGGGPLVAGQALTGEIDTAIHNQRIAIVHVATGRVRQVSPQNLHVYDFDWSPDGTQFAATAAPGPGDNNWWIAQLHVIDIVSSAARSIYKPALQIAVPRWSPDGGQIAFIEGLMSDEGIHGGDVFTISPSGGKARNHTKGRRTSPTSATWLSNTRLLVTEAAGGGSAVSTLDVESDAATTLWQGDERVVAGGLRPTLSITRDGQTVAVERQSLAAAPEVWVGPIGKWTQVTHKNAAQKRPWGAYHNVEWISDGLSIQGWLLEPREVKAGVRYPMVVWVHGGPASVKTPDWPA